MTLGEKIKCFRTLKKMTQKKLGELTGIGEATIRKYELGIRNPKPAQLKKIAQALEIGENVLLEIPLSTLSVETVGDVMSLLFLLESHVGIKYSGYQKEDGAIDPSTLMLHFENEKINILISQWLKEKQDLSNKAYFAKEMAVKYTYQEYNSVTAIETNRHEVKKQALINNTDLLDDSNGIYNYGPKE